MASSPPTSSQSVNVKKSEPTPTATPKTFRRERSFVVPRSPQVSSAGAAFHQQRERSFVRDGQRQNANGGNRSQRTTTSNNRGAKPNMEIYRPPKNKTGVNGAGMRSVETAVQASPAVAPATAAAAPHPPRPVRSRTSFDFSVPARTPKPSVALPAFAETAASASALKRSVGQQPETAALTRTGFDEVPDLSQFPEELQVLLRQVAADPKRATSRCVMDAVKQLFLCVVESSRYAAAAARYCAYIIELESDATFLESTLNACQEWFQDRDRVLRSPSVSSQRWAAFINFLSEMYLKLKRRQQQQPVVPKSPTVQGVLLTPDVILLTLLAECCCVTLRKPSAHSMQELECLLFVLTGIGRDVEQELPAKMVQIMAAIRDAFLDASTPSAAQRTLLQLVELRAAKWQLPATAVKYYYPSISSTTY